MNTLRRAQGDSTPTSPSPSALPCGWSPAGPAAAYDLISVCASFCASVLIYVLAYLTFCL